MTEAGERSGQDWSLLWEKAISNTKGLPRFQGVYTGPVWESENPAAPGGPRVWKVAVLERRPGAGAEHWGHLFLVLGALESEISIRPVGGVAGDDNRPEVEILPAIPGAPLRIQIRPRSPETRDRLREFALEFQRHAVAVAAD
jgi:hypothetical protein